MRDHTLHVSTRKRPHVVICSYLTGRGFEQHAHVWNLFLEIGSWSVSIAERVSALSNQIPWKYSALELQEKHLADPRLINGFMSVLAELTNWKANKRPVGKHKRWTEVQICHPFLISLKGWLDGAGLSSGGGEGTLETQMFLPTRFISFYSFPRSKELASYRLWPKPCGCFASVAPDSGIICMGLCCQRTSGRAWLKGSLFDACL